MNQWESFGMISCSRLPLLNLHTFPQYTARLASKLALLSVSVLVCHMVCLWVVCYGKLNCMCIFRSTYQMIRLQNPTDESLVLIPHCSNPANFSLELDNTKQILLPSAGLLEIPLKFTPSAIGQLHSAEISFQCPQVIPCCV